MAEAVSMKKGDMVSFEFAPKVSAYGVILWMEGETTAQVDYRNPQTGIHEVKPKELSELRKIGNNVSNK